MGKSVTLNVEQAVEIARDAIVPVYSRFQELQDAPANLKPEKLDELLDELGLAQVGLEDIARNTIESYSGNESEYMDHIQHLFFELKAIELEAMDYAKDNIDINVDPFQIIDIERANQFVQDIDSPFWADQIQSMVDAILPMAATTATTMGTFFILHVRNLTDAWR